MIPQVDNVKYLGFNIDEGLTWSPHIEATCDKLCSASFALSRLAPTLATENRKKAYYGYFHSILTYGIDLWATAADRDKPFKIQKRAIRALANKPHDHPAKKLFQQLEILTLPSVYILEACLSVRKNLGSYKTRAQQHGWNTRGQHLLLVPPRKLAKSRASRGVMGPRLYNALPTDIKNASSDAIFKNKLKKVLLDLACYTIDEFFEKIKSLTQT